MKSVLIASLNLIVFFMSSMCPAQPPRCEDAPPCPNLFSQLSVDILFMPPPGLTCSCTSSAAWAASSTLKQLWCCSSGQPEIYCGDDPPNVFEVDADSDAFGCGASAATSYSHAGVSGLGASGLALHIDSRVEAYCIGVVQPLRSTYFFTVSGAGATGHLDCPTNPNIPTRSTVTFASTGGANSSLPLDCYAFFAYRTPDGQIHIVGFRKTAYGLLVPPGSTYDPVTGEYNYVLEDGTITKPVVFYLCNSEFDVTGDGRFSLADLEFMSSFIGLPLSSSQRSYDLSGDGIFDQDDYDILAAVVASGYDSRRFGDRNADGQLCFTDSIQLEVFSHGYVLGQPEYDAALDFDLDGLLNDVDRVAYLSEVLPKLHDPDFNQDGNADQGDITTLVDVIAGGASPSSIDPDFNNDGSVDQGDINNLITVITGGSCGT